MTLVRWLLCLPAGFAATAGMFLFQRFMAWWHFRAEYWYVMEGYGFGGHYIQVPLLIIAIYGVSWGVGAVVAARVAPSRPTLVVAVWFALTALIMGVAIHEGVGYLSQLGMKISDVRWSEDILKLALTFVACLGGSLSGGLIARSRSEEVNAANTLSELS